MRLLGSTIIAVAVAATFSLATASSTEAGATWRGVKSPMNAEHVGIIILPAARFSYQHNTGFAGRRTRDKGLLISSRMTGGPTGAVSQTAKQLASQVAASPMARYLITMAGFGGAGAAALSPTEVDEKSKDPRIQKLQDLD